MTHELLIPPDIGGGNLPALGGREFHHMGEVFATAWSLKLVRSARTDPRGDNAYVQQIVRNCIAALDLIDRQMSLWIADSDIARFNALPAGEMQHLPEPFSIVVAQALELANLTNGAFSPGLWQAVESWGFGAQVPADPLASGATYAKTHGAGAAPCPKFDGNRLQKSEGFFLDLNGIAKGYGVDLLCQVARSHPDTAACLVEIGGELKGYGTHADGMPWTTSFHSGDRETPELRAALYGWACATSGIAERSFTAGERRYSHIIDPRTQQPSLSDLTAVSVLDPECWRADGLATALLVMGASEAMAFANAHDIACLLFVSGQSAPLVSQALRAWFEEGAA